MNCETCGEKLVGGASGYVCPKWHGKIVSADVVKQADALALRREIAEAIEAKRAAREKRLAAMPQAERHDVTYFTIEGQPGWWRQSWKGDGILARHGGGKIWLKRDTASEAAILKLAKEIEGAKL